MLRLTTADYEALRRHGEETYPHECCGVLLGQSEDGINAVHQVVRAGNTRVDSAHNRYNIAPQELVKIQREGRDQGWDIIGFYHSHPDHPARWSSTDLAEAHWLGCSYVITAVARGAAAETNSFLLSGESEETKALLEEAIEVQQPPGSPVELTNREEAADLRSIPA